MQRKPQLKKPPALRGLISAPSAASFGPWIPRQDRMWDTGGGRKPMVWPLSPQGRSGLLLQREHSGRACGRQLSVTEKRGRVRRPCFPKVQSQLPQSKSEMDIPRAEARRKQGRFCQAQKGHLEAQGTGMCGSKPLPHHGSTPRFTAGSRRPPDPVVEPPP